jgi:hypothetical protein
MATQLAKTDIDDPEANRKAIQSAIRALEEEVLHRLERKEYFGTVSLQINFASGKHNWHRVTSEYTSKPVAKN